MERINAQARELKIILLQEPDCRYQKKQIILSEKTTRENTYSKKEKLIGKKSSERTKWLEGYYKVKKQGQNRKRKG